MRRFSALALLMWPVLAAAQDSAPRAITTIAGDSIRVALRDGRRLEGSLQRWTSDSLALRRVAGSHGTDTVMALSHVSVVEHRVPRHTAGSAFKGMRFGALAGSAAGAVAACAGEMCALAILLIPAGAVVGGVGGLLVGATGTTSVWEIVWRSEGAGP